MPPEHPPTLDPAAAARWPRRAPPRSPWLHDEVARRMAERLEWIRLQPQAWAHWSPLRGGLAAQELLEKRYPSARCLLVEPDPARAAETRQLLGRAWWQRWSGPAREVVAMVPDGAVQMLWANMALHFAAGPQQLMAQWHRALATDGFLMFSCFGPDTARELRALYAALGWGPSGPEFTDMHDWGDMLVAGGFAEPVMDMERITLTWDSPAKLLAELRELGANLHPGRFPALRGRRWRDRLHEELASRLRGPDGRLAITFEIVYGHAIRPAPRVRMQASTSIPVDDLRGLLRGGPRPPR
ncbi:biotin synthase [Ramlibacter humi]|uniref:Biotin synthase n=1 Tax=Ramlibacter humi TaxID=2530451 RepID=A0A4Z0BYC1_9BURK|nr:biotin synthase [Ramlibacter humi]TFZ03682.1 biotin synthase [Ramlibacter humi]